MAPGVLVSATNVLCNFLIYTIQSESELRHTVSGLKPHFIVAAANLMELSNFDRALAQLDLCVVRLLTC
jgi:hypothetical protein